MFTDPPSIWCNLEQKRVKYDECINCAKCLPSPFIKLIFDTTKPYIYQENRYGVTELLWCLRRSFYERTSINYPTLHDLYILCRGIMFHQFFNSLFNLKEVKIEKNFKIENEEFTIVGIIDGIWEDTMFEIKSVANLPVFPRPQHVVQLQSYYTLLNSPKIKKLMIIYFSMNNFNFFTVPLENKEQWLKERAYKLHICLKENKVPDREEGVYCSWCPFYVKCKL